MSDPTPALAEALVRFDEARGSRRVLTRGHYEALARQAFVFLRDVWLRDSTVTHGSACACVHVKKRWTSDNKEIPLWPSWP